MPLKSYGVLKSKPIETMLSKDKAHLEIHMVANGMDYRIALNVHSKATPPELNYIIFKDFIHPFTEHLTSLKEGITTKAECPNIALDYIRGNIFDYKRMKKAQDISFGDNELSDTIDLYIERAIKTNDAMIYAFGEYWGPEEMSDVYFGFNPGQGIHDIHMNQGNAGSWTRDNGIYQDGGLLIHFPAEKRWVAMFLSFKSQTYHTDDVTGNAKEPDLSKESAMVIVSALLNSSVNKASVSLLNVSNKPVDLTGWSLAGLKNKSQKLKGIVGPDEFFKVAIDKKALVLSPDGGIITLLDDNGTKMCGVSYTTPNYAVKDHTTVFA